MLYDLLPTCWNVGNCGFRGGNWDRVSVLNMRVLLREADMVGVCFDEGLKPRPVDLFAWMGKWEI